VEESKKIGVRLLLRSHKENKANFNIQNMEL
jgi:hypothetical protein